MAQIIQVMDDHDLVLKPIIIVSGILNFKKALLVGGTPTPLKHMNVSWGYDIPNWMDSHKTCSKPPTSLFVYGS